MTGHDLEYFREWFSGYTKQFYLSDHEEQKNIMLKVVHTENVCANAKEIARGSSLNEHKGRVAETAALFHDLGRFQQYARHKTFSDAESINHGLLGSRILSEEGPLENLPDDEQQFIIQTVRFHNAFAIPAGMNGDQLLYLKLVRDADKLDIFRVFIEYFESPMEERASATAFGVPDTPGYSEAMLRCIFNKEVASYSNIRTENDFKLMTLSWVYDMHFKESLKLLRKRTCLNRIIEKLPRTDDIHSAIRVLRQYISERLNDSGKK